jgi:hypothetical protein
LQTAQAGALLEHVFWAAAIVVVPARTPARTTEINVAFMQSLSMTRRLDFVRNDTEIGVIGRLDLGTNLVIHASTNFGVVKSEA